MSWCDGIVALRFANQVFEPILNANHVARVDISWLESLTLEGRADYYDRAGALKDMLQNHLMEALSLVVMEEPARLDAVSFRNSRVEALRNIATPTLADIRPAPSAPATPPAPSAIVKCRPMSMNPASIRRRGTETYAAITLSLQNRRWAGVPFTLRSGKSMPADTAEIAIHFRPLPPHLFDLQRRPAGQCAAHRADGVLCAPRHDHQRLRSAAVQSRSWRCWPRQPERSAYANLILEMFHNSPTLFIRGDEAEEAWRIIDPIAHAWAEDKVPMQSYPAGQAPPATPA